MSIVSQVFVSHLSCHVGFQKLSPKPLSYFYIAIVISQVFQFNHPSTHLHLQQSIDSSNTFNTKLLLHKTLFNTNNSLSTSTSNFNSTLQPHTNNLPPHTSKCLPPSPDLPRPAALPASLHPSLPTFDQALEELATTAATSLHQASQSLHQLPFLAHLATSTAALEDPATLAVSTSAPNSSSKTTPRPRSSARRTRLPPSTLALEDAATEPAASTDRDLLRSEVPSHPTRARRR